MTPKRCRYCGRWFHPHTSEQKSCPRKECRRAREREKWRNWKKRHPGHADKWRPKVRAWAQAANYWSCYRRSHPGYVERDNKRRRTARRKACRAANDTGAREILVEKLRTVVAAEPFGAANDTGRDRRVEALVEVLIWKESAANRNRIVCEAGAAR